MQSSIPLKDKTNQRLDNHIEEVLTNRAIKQEKLRQKRINTNKTMETCLKIIVNVGISALAYFNIQQLLPYHLNQQEKLGEINEEINKIKPRVKELEANFSKTFDPNLTRKNIEKNTYKVDPNISNIFFVSPKK